MGREWVQYILIIMGRGVIQFQNSKKSKFSKKFKISKKNYKISIFFWFFLILWNMLVLKYYENCVIFWNFWNIEIFKKKISIFILIFILFFLKFYKKKKYFIEIYHACKWYLPTNTGWETGQISRAADRRGIFV
jgi:hypothetical protein